MNYKEVEYIKVILPVRYEDDDIPYDFPNRKNDTLTLTINMNNGEIEDFPKDLDFDLFMKVTDSGIYQLLNKDFNIIKEINTYVPDSSTIPGKYGDYVDFSIRKGVIVNLLKNPTYEEFND